MPPATAGSPSALAGLISRKGHGALIGRGARGIALAIASRRFAGPGTSILSAEGKADRAIAADRVSLTRWRFDPNRPGPNTATKPQPVERVTGIEPA